MSSRLRHADGSRRRITLLNSRDIAALNRAREVLKRVEDAAWRRSLDHYDPYAPVTAWDLGRLSGAASVADEAIFHVLSTARNNCHVNVTDAQLFGTERTPAQAETAPETAPLTEVPTHAAARPLPRDGRPSNRAVRAVPPDPVRPP